ncbi:ABC transporter ATP-binding protein [Paenibacillus koleovorans]|uniref:ABC transporter ATP-binding protein n=1 Tax=Paenibacillus koleovorans TaxID=121608 RepID=UPI000FD9F739|nr:ABC transporter ATP-binding protein [Paenibacillus koleovorans]
MVITMEHVSKLFDRRPVLADVSGSVRRGELFGIIGPNGSGKSTLLKLLSGVEKADSGVVELDGRPVAGYSRRELARWVAVLQQEPLPAIGFKVRDVVEMGRFPFQNWLGDETGDTSALIEGIIEKLGLGALAERTLEHLSGGERQRVALAKVMAQQPKLLLLDEPTTYLDIGYQVQMMDAVRRWQTESDLTVVAVLHDLNLAAQYCDRLLVLHEGVVASVGTPAEVMRRELIAAVYGTEPIIAAHPVSGVPQIMLQPGWGAGARAGSGAAVGVGR